jgi:hypothetical protein
MMRRRTLALILALTVAGTGFGMAFVATPVASANVCTSIPSLPVIPNPLKTVCTVVTKAPTILSNPIGTIGGIVTAPLKAAGDAVMKGVTDWVADGAAWLVGEAGTLINETTTPTLSAPWFTGQYQTMAALAAIFALPLLFLSVIEGVMRRDGRIIVRAACVHLPAAFLLTAGAVVIVGLFIAMTDQMCAQVTASVSGDAKTFFGDVGKSLTTLAAQTGTGPAVPLFAVFLGGLIAAVGSFFVWIELLIRSAAIYVAVLFLPFSFVAMIWPQTAKWCRRLVELLFAIIFAKFVIVAIMALAAAGLLSAGTGQGLNGVLAGTALLFLASFSPMVLLRLIPMVEGAAHAHANRSGAGSQTLGPVAGPAATMRRVMDGNWGSGGGGGGLRATPAAAAAGPAGFAAAGGAAAMSGAARTATHATNSAAGTSTATSSQRGGRHAAVNGNGNESGAGEGSSGGAAGSSTATSPPRSAGSGPSSSPRQPASAGQQRPSFGGQPPAPGSAGAPGAASSSRPPAQPPRDPDPQRGNDQQTGRDS